MHVCVHVYVCVVGGEDQETGFGLPGLETLLEIQAEGFSDISQCFSIPVSFPSDVLFKQCEKFVSITVDIHYYISFRCTE